MAEAMNYETTVFGTMRIKTSICPESVNEITEDFFDHVYGVQVYEYGVEFRTGGKNYFYSMASIVWFCFTPDKETS